MKTFKNLRTNSIFGYVRPMYPHPFTKTTILLFHHVTIFNVNLLTTFPLHAQIGFQSPGTPVMEGIIDFHHDLMFFLLYILGFVVWFLCIIGYSYYNRFPSTRDLNLLIYKHHINFIRVPSKQNHHLWLEIIWTVIPALILISIVLPSFALIYSMDEFLLRPRVTLKAIGNQWYWTYNLGCSLSAQESPISETDEVIEMGGVDPDGNKKKPDLVGSYTVAEAEDLRRIFRLSLEVYFLQRVYNNPIHTLLPTLILLENPELDNSILQEIRDFAKLNRFLSDRWIMYEELKAVAPAFMDVYPLTFPFQHSFTSYCLDCLYKFRPEDLDKLFTEYELLTIVDEAAAEEMKNTIDFAIDCLILACATDPESSGLDEEDIQILAQFINDAYVENIMIEQARDCIKEDLKAMFIAEHVNKMSQNFYELLSDSPEIGTSTLYTLSLDDDGFIKFALHGLLVEQDIFLHPGNKETIYKMFKKEGVVLAREDLDLVYTLLLDTLGGIAKDKEALQLLLNNVFSDGSNENLEDFVNYYDQLMLGYCAKLLNVELPGNPIDRFDFSPSLQAHICSTLELGLLVKDASSSEVGGDDTDFGCTACVVDSEPAVEARRHFALKFDSYMLPTDMLERGHLRLLEVDKRVVLPTRTGIRLLVSSYDVLHSWAVPAFGIKLDGCPGRLNQTFIYIKNEGLYYGQCSEICGVNHAFMPIVIKAVDPEEFNFWLLRRIEVFNALTEAMDKHKLKMNSTDVLNTDISDIASIADNNED